VKTYESSHGDGKFVYRGGCVDPNADKEQSDKEEVAAFNLGSVFWCFNIFISESK